MSFLIMASSLILVISILDGPEGIVLDCQRNISPQRATETMDAMMYKFARKMLEDLLSLFSPLISQFSA